VGNVGLCGSPLSHGCDRPESSTRDDVDNDSENWDVQSIEVGVACGLAVVTGCLLCSHIDSCCISTIATIAAKR
jgi:hypothetical protein